MYKTVAHKMNNIKWDITRSSRLS